MKREETPIEFIAQLPSDIKPIVVALRDGIIRTVPDVKESVVWGALSYHRPQIGGRVKGSVCLIVVKDSSVRLDFIHGIRLRDPKHILQGDRVSKRYVPIPSVRAAVSSDVLKLIKEVASLNPT